MRTSLQPFNLAFLFIAACGAEDLATVESSAPLLSPCASADRAQLVALGADIFIDDVWAPQGVRSGAQVELRGRGLDLLNGVPAEIEWVRFFTDSGGQRQLLVDHSTFFQTNVSGRRALLSTVPAGFDADHGWVAIVVREECRYLVDGKVIMSPQSVTLADFTNFEYGTVRLGSSAPPTAPTHLEGLRFDPLRVLLSWQPGRHAHGQRVQFRDARGRWVTLHSVNPEENTYQARGLPTAPDHFFRIEAFNELGVAHSLELRVGPAAVSESSGVATLTVLDETVADAPADYILLPSPIAGLGRTYVSELAAVYEDYNRDGVVDRAQSTAGQSYIFPYSAIFDNTLGQIARGEGNRFDKNEATGQFANLIVYAEIPATQGALTPRQYFAIHLLADWRARTVDLISVSAGDRWGARGRIMTAGSYFVDYLEAQKDASGGLARGRLTVTLRSLEGYRFFRGEDLNVGTATYSTTVVIEFNAPIYGR